MKIRTALSLGIALVTVAAAAVALVFVNGAAVLERTSAQEDAVHRLLVDIGELEIVLHEYTEHFEERPLRQWIFKHTAITQRLQSIPSDEGATGQQLAALQADNEQIRELFGNLVELHARGQAQPSDVAEQRDFILSLLVVKLKDLLSQADDLQTEINAREDEARSLVMVRTAWALSGMLLVAVFAALALRRRLAAGMERLLSSTEAIGRGDFDYRIRAEQDDELGAIGSAVDAMAEKLKAVTASRDELRRETDAREMAQRAVQEAHAELAAIFEHAPGALLTWDAELRIVRWSPSAERLFDWSADEMIGRPLEACGLFHEDDAPLVIGHLRELLQRGLRHFTWRSRNRTRSGRIRHCEWHSGVVLDADGRFLTAISFGVDITQRKRMEDALNESQMRLRVALKAAKIGTWELDPETGELNLSPELKAMYGFDPDAEAILAAHLARGSAGGVLNIEHSVTSPDGSVRWMHIQGRARRRPGSPGSVMGVVIDVTERKQAELALKESEQRFRATFEHAAVGIARVALDGRLLEVNARFCEITGYSEAELLATDFQSITHPDDLARDLEHVERLATGQTGIYNVEKRYVRKDGVPVWANLTVAVVRDAVEGRLYFIAVVEDIDARKQAEEQLRIAANALDNAAEGVVITRLGRIVSVNRAFTAITGFTPDEVLDQPIRLLHSVEHERAHQEERRRTVAATGRWQGEIWGRRKDGEIYPAWSSVSRICDDGGESLYVSVFSDISAAKRYEARLQHLAHHDVLTGLPNRALFHERLREMLARAERHGHVTALLYIDLDRFKPINDTLGHAAGDDLLRLVAARLKGCVRTTDTVARLGGDEFAVLLDELRSPEEAGLIARNMLDALASPFALLGQDQYISASIGVGCYPGDGRDAETLMRHADVAMYQAKKDGRNDYRFFAPAMNAQAAEKLFLTNSLRAALERGELKLVYQPRLCLETGQVVGIEALVRWEHPERGTILPARFISLAEETGLIEPIGEWVLLEAARQMRRWKDDALVGGRMAVNLSPRQFVRAELAKRVFALLEEARLSPCDLELEVTEGMVMEHPERAAQVLGDLAGAGIAVSIDDFGTGYSSLGYLKRFPVHCLKIDRTFVAGLPGDASDTALTKAIVAMARSLDLCVTAEGVENAAQATYLAKIGCNCAQGHYFSRPLSGEDMTAFLRAVPALPRPA